MAKKTKKVSFRTQIDKIADDKLQEVMAKLPERVEKALERCFSSLLGLNVSAYGSRGGEIDHCNGRWNLFAEVLKAEAVKDVSEMIKKIKTKYSFDEFADAFKKEYISHFKYQLKYQAAQKAKELATKLIDERIEELIPKKLDIAQE